MFLDVLVCPEADLACLLIYHLIKRDNCARVAEKVPEKPRALKRPKVLEKRLITVDAIPHIAQGTIRAGPLLLPDDWPQLGHRHVAG